MTGPVVLNALLAAKYSPASRDHSRAVQEMPGTNETVPSQE
jgi:hypothetical protein